MPHKNAEAGKCLERLIANVIGGKRFWANSGESVDVESETLVIQAKHVKVMSLGALTRLALQAESDARERGGKIGCVAAKLRLGYGVRTPILFCFTEGEFRRLMEGRT